MTILQQLVGEISDVDHESLGAEDFLQACQQFNDGTPYDKVISRLRNWAHDARVERYCQGQDAIRFDADH